MFLRSISKYARAMTTLFSNILRMNFGIPKWNSNDDDDGYKGVNDIRNGYQNTMTTNNHAII